jgi:hypothetical protein
MPKIPVAQAPAGPALDAAVAEARTGNKWEEGWMQGVRPYPWSTDIAAAWELVEAEYMAIIPLDNGMWVAPLDVAMTNYWNSPDGELALSYYELHLGNSIVADTAPLAIARAYLKAKGVEEVEVPD